MSAPRDRSNNPSAAARRTALLDAATDVVREHGFGSATVKAITARAGMSAGLLYSYADSVDGLLAEAFRRAAGAELAAVDEAVRAAPADATLRLTALVDVFARRALRGSRLAWALLAEPVGRSIDEERIVYRRGYASLVAELITAGIQAGQLPPQDAQITAAGIVGAIGEALAGPLAPLALEPVDDEHVIDAITQLCLRAAGASTCGDDRTETQDTR